MNFWKMLGEWLKKVFGGTTTTTTTPTGGTTSTTTVATTDDSEAAHGLTDISKVTLVGGAEWRNATKTFKMITLSWAGSEVDVTWEPHSDWTHHSGSGGTPDGICDGMVCVVYQRSDGGWTGGKFDHVPQNRTGYRWGFKHVREGYKGHIAPNVGAEFAIFLCSYDGAERSSMQWTKWK